MGFSNPFPNHYRPVHILVHLCTPLIVHGYILELWVSYGWLVALALSGRPPPVNCVAGTMFQIALSKVLFFFSP